MKISKLISKLEKFRTKHGEIEVSVWCDQENHPEKKPTDKEICTVLWHGDDDKPHELMICDRFVSNELG
jgi:hypothetical protein